MFLLGALERLPFFSYLCLRLLKRDFIVARFLWMLSFFSSTDLQKRSFTKKIFLRENI